VTEIAKGVLGGSWALVTGWMLPAGLGLVFFGLIILPSLESVPVFEEISKAGASDKGLILLTASVVLGLILASMATPLYRVLEGYLLWPRALQAKGIKRHRKKRNEARANISASATPGQALDVQTALAVEKFHRYPDDDAQVAPTRLGNAIRRFEYYSYDRYRLSSQLMWSQIRGVVEDSVSKEVQDARAGVDFFVCLLYVSALVALSALGGLFLEDRNVLALVLSVIAALVVVVGCYFAAVAATDAWAAAVRGMIDLARVPLAEALGLDLPDTVAGEREMWNDVGWFMRYAYNEKGGATLDAYRSRSEDKNP
jgi:hypothetical protein